ncbi:glycosyltransferase [Clostridium tyrobutyricum]|uniref:tetratricopeptide repeat-containing glycosyltransferase family 2 protein n=1 Tax=Clostridium tyrobutyricum TaxID=1519 RepID=UPI001C38AAFD|nr:glycosyltransferase family 2 protein [Clostridium tyrobutyricum]MBV4445941.1 glycosyltransferase [Clostridium tyrobutyricum]
MKLSICMMVKDEEKNLERCLESLYNLIQEIESELIIVDTGSQDNTVDIAKQYTDKVYFHKWNNDFSSMRNITIDYASGDWIFIIDADEEIEDDSEIIKFFKSNRQYKYKTVEVNVKSITNVQKNQYVDIPSPRMFVNDGTFKYRGRVHNMPVYKKPCILLNTTFIHYGYIETDNELMEKKFKRTSSLLLEELKNNSENIYYNYQLSVSYAMHKEYKKALNQIKRTYNLIEKNHLDKRAYVYIYFEMATWYYAAGGLDKFDHIEKICKEGIALEKEYIDLYFMLGRIYLLQDNYIESEKYFNKYIVLMDNIDKLNIIKNGTIKLSTLDRKEEVYFNLSFVYYSLKDYSKSYDYMNKFNKDEYIEHSFNFIINVHIELKKYTELKLYYLEKICSLKEKARYDFCKYLDDNIDEMSKINKVELISSFSGDEDDYCLINTIRFYYLTEQIEDLIKSIDRFIKIFNLNNTQQYCGDIIYYEMKLNNYLGDILFDVHQDKITEYITYIVDTYKDGEETLRNYVDVLRDTDEFKDTRLNKVFRRCLLILNMDDEYEFENTFNKYIKNGFKYINAIYKPCLIENELIYEVKSQEEMFFIYMYKADEFKNYKSKYIKYLKKALEVYPCMKNGIELFLNKVKNEVNKKDNKFENYKKKVKITIKALIDNNKLNEANKIIDEYEQIVKDDLEIVLFKSKISLKRLKNVNASYKM